MTLSFSNSDTSISSTDVARACDLMALAALVARIVYSVLFTRTTVFDTLLTSTLKGLDAFFCYLSIVLALLVLLLRRTYAGRGAFLLVGLYVCMLLISGDRTSSFQLADDAVLLIALTTVDSRRSMRVYYVAGGLLVAFVVISSSLSLTYNGGTVPNARLVFRYGFTHPNNLGALLFAVIVAMSFVHWEDGLWLVTAILSLIVACFSYIVLGSHAPAVVCTALALFSIGCHVPLMRRYARRAERISSIALVALPLVLFLGITFITAHYDENNAIMKMISLQLHSRPRLANRYYSAVGGFTLLGQERYNGIELYASQSFFSLDSGYAAYSLVHGVLVFAIQYVAYVIAVLRMTRNRCHPMAVVAIALYALYMILEKFTLQLAKIGRAHV